jgi:hypothetical protein
VDAGKGKGIVAMIEHVTDWLARTYGWRPQQAATLPLAESLLARLTRALPADAVHTDMWPYVGCICLDVAVKLLEVRDNHIARRDLVTAVPEGTPLLRSGELLALEIQCLAALRWRLMPLPDLGGFYEQQPS